MIAQPERFYTVKEVAAMLQFSENTIMRRIKDGAIEVVRSNGDKGHIRISQSALNRFAAGEQQQQRAQRTQG